MPSLVAEEHRRCRAAECIGAALCRHGAQQVGIKMHHTHLLQKLAWQQCPAHPKLHRELQDLHHFM